MWPRPCCLLNGRAFHWAALIQMHGHSVTIDHTCTGTQAVPSRISSGKRFQLG
jgi:hypothetical protein